MEIIIQKATKKDIKALAIVGKKAFYTSHKDAIPKNIMQAYLDASFNEEKILEEITNPNFQYHVLYYNDKLVGFSKIIFNQTNKKLDIEGITKMERLYLLEEFYGLGLGKQLFEFNTNLAKKNNQKGTWLYVWIKNYRAINFYKKAGFKNIGEYDFPVSKTESRPNYVMYLEL